MEKEEKKNYPYLLAVTWDRELENLETAKKILVRYFSLKKISEGGPCMCQDITRRNMTIGYERKEVRDRVLRKKTHEVKNERDEKFLEVTVQLIADSNYAPPSTRNAAADNAAVAPLTSSHAVPTRRFGDEENKGQTADMETSHAHGAAGTSKYSSQNPPLERETRENVSTDMETSGDNDWNRERKGDQMARNKGEGEDNALSANSSEGSNQRFLNYVQGIPGEKGEDQKGSSSEQRENDGSRKRKEAELAQNEVEGEDNVLSTNSSGWSKHKFPSDVQDIPEKKGEDHRGSSSEQRENDGKTYTDNVERDPRFKRKSSTNSEDRPDPPTLPNIDEIFTAVVANLQTDLINKTLREKMVEKFPDVTVKVSVDGAAVKGTFKQIEAVYKYLQQELSIPGKMSSATQSEETLPEMKADHVCISSALCDYVMEIYQAELKEMERRYKVKIIPEVGVDTSTYIKFIPQGSGSSVEAAKERFTEKVQNVLSDWQQETVESSSAHMPFSDIKQCLRSQFSNTLVIQQGTKIVLRGPKEELVQAKWCLEKGQSEPALSPRTEPSHPPRTEPSHPPRPVSISTRDMKTEIPVDPRHLDILRKLKNQEIYDIEKKYNVMLAEKKEKNGVITFTPLNGSIDLVPHAAHSFITLLQKTFFNIQKKVISVKSDVSQDQVCVLEEELKMGGVNVIMEYLKGSVVVIGHTSHVSFAEEMLTGHQKVGRAPAVAPPKSDTQEPMDTSESATSKPKPEEEEDKCPICLCEIEDKVTFPKCKHVYCRPCLQRLMSHKPVCAICGVACGEVRGNQPEGSMTSRTSSYSLPGYPRCGTIEIYYSFPSGTQQENHPHPGRHYSGTSRTAYLPDNPEGRDILRLLRKAFDQRLIFTVGDSRTSGATDTVTWNDVHHKTSTHGGPQSFGYPDPDYLKRVRDELKAKGVE